MSSAQTWTVIGLFFTILVGSQALVLRVVRLEIRAATAELRDELHKELAALSTELREGFAEIRATLAAHADRLTKLEGR